MSVTVALNGTNYTIPTTRERGWGAQVTAWIQAVSTSTLQLNGGTFTLTADADFGANFGLKSLYYKSRSATPSTAGQVRLGNTESIGWRNAANDGNLLLLVNASDELEYNGTVLAGAAPLTASRALVSDGSGNIDVSAVTATELGYVSGVTSAIQTQINTKAASFTSSQIICDTPSGHGSDGTKIRTWTNVATTGSAISYTASASNSNDGDKFTINTAGLYALSWSDGYSGGTGNIGFSLNVTTEMITNIQSVTTANRLIMAVTISNGVSNVSTVARLAANDFIYCHDDGNSDKNSAFSQFRIVRIG